jgi:DNA modification methylase
MKPREVDTNTTEFKSKLEDLMPAEELIFPASPGFGPYKSIMPPEAVAHPAKFNVHLVEFLVEKYTKPGDVVLDCMAGTGILGVIAALRGRNAIQVEIEPRFYEWMEKARLNVENTPTLGKKGKIINILGDARKLSELLSQNINTIITSPPYAETISHRSGGPVRVRKVGSSTITARQYSRSESNIGNLPLGNVEATTSPHHEKNLESLYRRLLNNGKPTYLSEMLKVYSEMYKVLKPGGYSIIVIKPYIRNKSVIDLPYYTWLLMEKVGFKLEKLYKFRLPAKSFWRILYYRRFPTVPEIAHEYVIVTVKP